MARLNSTILAFNRGIVSRLGLARVDLEKMRLLAARQENWMPRTLGSMMLRPGLEYTGATKSNLYARHIPFIYSTSDTALIEMTASTMRVVIDDVPITRVSVSTAVTNGTFGTDLTGWTNADEAGASSAWVTGGYMGLTGTGFNAAIRRQQVTVASGDQNKEHALRIVIAEAPVVLRVGSSSGDDDYISQTTLGIGTHSLALTPTGNFWVEFQNVSNYRALVDSVSVEAAGVMEIATPWSTDDLVKSLRWDQSADVVYIASSGLRQRKVERRSARSWSLVNFSPTDGPFRIINTGPTTLTPSALSGDITLTASSALFRSTHVGALFRIQSNGQTVSAALAGDGQATDSIRVTGVGSSRNFHITISGTWSGTVSLQASFGSPDAWLDVNRTYTTNQDFVYDLDRFDNQIVYWRLVFKTGDYTSGSATCTLSFSGGGITGVARVTAYTSPTQVSAKVLKNFGGTDSSLNWYEGAWSDYRGWPSAVALYEGRLYWAGKGSIWGSVSDAYESYDDNTEGDAGPISRTIGSGPVDTINWLVPVQRLLIGTQGSEISARSSTFDEPLTPTNFNLKDVSTYGSLTIPAIKIDKNAIFAQRAGGNIYEMSIDATQGDYASDELTKLVPDLCDAGIVALAVQRQPDTRIHVLLSDGTVAVLVYDRAENVACWVTVVTDGDVEDIVVLPDSGEDAVYYCVKRTVNGGTVRYRERWAQEADCRGGTLNKQADSFTTYSGSATSTITGLDHLEGESVIVWADGVDMSPGWDAEQTTYTVASGSITLGQSVSNAVVGLPYKATYQTRKLAEGAQFGTALTQKKKVDHVGLILADTHAKGLRYGQSLDVLDDLPGIEDYAAVSADHIYSEYDEPSLPLDGTWDTDSRVVLAAHAPRPCTALGLVITMTTNEKV